MASGFAERMAKLTADQRLHFYEVLGHNLTVVVRAIWSDSTFSDADKVEMMRWVNEVLHATTAKVWTVRLSGHEWTDEDFAALVLDCCHHCLGIAGLVGDAIAWTFKAVGAEPLRVSHPGRGEHLGDGTSVEPD